MCTRVTDPDVQGSPGSLKIRGKIQEKAYVLQSIIFIRTLDTTANGNLTGRNKR